MSQAYAAFIEVINSHLSRNPTVTPCWLTVLSDIRSRFPTFNRSIKTLQRWYKRYRKEVNSAAQELTTGRKVNSELKETIREHILQPEGKARSYRSTASTFHIPRSTARLYIKHHIGFIRKMKQNIPYALSIEQKKLRVYYSTIMMKILEVSKEVDYKNIITGDESYFVYDYEPNWAYLPPETPPPPRVKSHIHSKKLMLTIFLWGGGLCLLADIPEHSTMTSDVYINKILTPISEWWGRQQQIPSEEWDMLKENTDRAIVAASTAVQSIIGKELSGWKAQKLTAYHKLEFIKTFQSQAIQRIEVSTSNPTPAAPLTPTLPVISEQSIPPPTQIPTTKPPIESHNHFQRRTFIASALNPGITAPLESTSIAQFIPQSIPSFPLYTIHRSLQYPPSYSNAASLLQLLFGSEMFKRIILSLKPESNIPPFLCDIHDLFEQLSIPQVSSVDLGGYQSLQSIFLTDDTRTALNHNIQLLRSYFWSNLKLVDIENISIPLRCNLSSSTQRYIEQSFETVSLPVHPPTGLLIYVERLLPSGDKLNTTFYFPVYDTLTIPQYNNVQYELRGLITHTNQTQFTAIVQDSEDERWIHYLNGRNNTLIDSSWPSQLAYGDDYNDGCSSACALYYEQQQTSSRLSTHHDTYTPFKQRRLLHAHTHAKQAYRNPMATPDHARKYDTFGMESDSESLSSDFLSSTSTSSTLFDEDDSESKALEYWSSSTDEEKETSSSESGSGTAESSMATVSSIEAPTSIQPLSLMSEASSTAASSFTSTPTSPYIPPQPPTSTPSQPHSLITSTPTSPFIPPPSSTPMNPLPYPDPSSIPSIPAPPPTQTATLLLPTSQQLDSPGTVERSVFVDNNGAMHIAAAPSHNQHPLELFLHVDNARVHTSFKATEFLESLPFIKFPHPPYSPDIAPCDFFLFGYLKRKLAMDGIHASDITNVVRKYLLEIDSEVYLHVYDHWYDRLKWVASHGGEYYPANNRKQLVEEYKHLYHLRSNASQKAAEDKPYLCKFCNRRYSSIPSLQTHQSLKHSLRQSGAGLSSARKTIVPKEANGYVAGNHSPLHSQLGIRLVKHFSCVPVGRDSISKKNLHQLSLRIWNSESKETVSLAGTLILQQFVKTNLKLPLPSAMTTKDVQKDLPQSCSFCRQRFSTQIDLLIHCAKSHPESLKTGNNLLKCTLCSALFPTIKGLLTHIGMQHKIQHHISHLDHSPQHSCQIQQMPIKGRDEQITVQSNDSAEEIWLCPYCDRKFETRASTKMHTRKMHKDHGHSAIELLNSFLNDIITEDSNIQQTESAVSERWRRLQRLTDDTNCDIRLLQNKIVYVLCKLYYCSD